MKMKSWCILTIESLELLYSPLKLQLSILYWFILNIFWALEYDYYSWFSVWKVFQSRSDTTCQLNHTIRHKTSSIRWFKMLTVLYTLLSLTFGKLKGPFEGFLYLKAFDVSRFPWCLFWPEDSTRSLDLGYILRDPTFYSLIFLKIHWKLSNQNIYEIDIWIEKESDYKMSFSLTLRLGNWYEFKDCRC